VMAAFTVPITTPISAAASASVGIAAFLCLCVTALELEPGARVCFEAGFCVVLEASEAEETGLSAVFFLDMYSCDFLVKTFLYFTRPRSPIDEK
jgi:hypothetical protein